MRLKLLSSSGQDILSSKTYFTKISVKGGLCNIHFVFSLILSAIAAKYCIKPNSCLYIVYLADFEEISILYQGMKKMVTSQTVYDTDPAPTPDPVLDASCLLCFAVAQSPCCPRPPPSPPGSSPGSRRRILPVSGSASKLKRICNKTLVLKKKVCMMLIIRLQFLKHTYL